MFLRQHQEIGDHDEKVLGEQEDENEKSSRYYTDSTSLPWICSTICLLFILRAQSIYYAGIRRGGTYGAGFATEFGPAPSTIEVIEVEFSGNLEYTENGHLYTDLGQDGIRYFGEPSPEVDQAWEDLIGEHMTFPISDDDAEALRRTSTHLPVLLPGWVGPDVLHTLHCVNQVRKILDSEYHFNSTLDNSKRVKRLYIDHCLNHIRQIIQCHMDLTPATSKYFESVDTYTGNFKQVHTCRDISKLREWMVERSLRDPPISLDSVSDNSTHGYLDNDDALMPWDWRESEFE